ncbi:unnamed protein product [Adineta steineri]|uniref:Uncharacterized protein n=1 Tax=Adineta steineri TaxID=433720 RepID=A0A814JX53_9BILA|nr:unnamed protein product [Adineta steineri]CAF1178175.1 unnamed protein product [Adineta steineri]
MDSSLADANNHFLGEIITWRLLIEPATGTPIAITFTQTYSWTYSLITCANVHISGSQLIPTGPYPSLPTEPLDCIADCASGATSYVAPNIRSRCTDTSFPLGITVGQRSNTVFVHAGIDFSVA